jgi:capsular polysaccharide biosynthesis protein
MAFLRFDVYKPKNWLKRRLRPTWIIVRRWPHQLRLMTAKTAACLLPFAAIEKERLYPSHSISESTPTWAQNCGRQFGATISHVDAACTVAMPLPKTVHKQIRRQFLMDQAYDYPATFVSTIPKGRAISRGLVFTPDGHFLKDVSTYFHDPNITTSSALVREWKLQPITQVEGRVTVLATDGANLYYHWLFQLLPRYELMRLASIQLDQIDYFYVNSLRSRFQRETLAAIGIEPSRIIDGEKVPYLRARELIVPSVPLAGGCFRPWMVDFLRKNFLSKGSYDMTSRRRLYISRGLAGYRRVLNEREVVEFLKKRGFEVAAMETMSVSEQAVVMASCSVVVAPHGGGMSNLIFCSPGTKVVEIYSPELVATYFWKLSNQLGLDYYYMMGKGGPATLDTDYPQSWDSHADIQVDLDLLQQTLELAEI